MKPGLAVRLARLNIRFIQVVGCLAVVSTLQTGCSRPPVEPSPSISQPQELAQSRPPAAHSSVARVVCPPVDLSAMSAPQTKGGHRVVLSWKASAPADSKHSAAVGYCIYRGTRPDSITELLNSQPVPGSRCIDDLVENGKKYFYSVRAISAQSVITPNAKLVQAQIPNLPPSKTDVSADSTPSCRQPAGTK